MTATKLFQEIKVLLDKEIVLDWQVESFNNRKQLKYF